MSPHVLHWNAILGHIGLRSLTHTAIPCIKMDTTSNSTTPTDPLATCMSLVPLLKDLYLQFHNTLTCMSPHVLWNAILVHISLMLLTLTTVLHPKMETSPHPSPRRLLCHRPPNRDIYLLTAAPSPVCVYCITRLTQKYWLKCSPTRDGSSSGKLGVVGLPRRSLFTTPYLYVLHVLQWNASFIHISLKLTITKSLVPRWLVPPTPTPHPLATYHVFSDPLKVIYLLLQLHNTLTCMSPHVLHWNAILVHIGLMLLTLTTVPRMDTNLPVNIEKHLWRDKEK